MGLGTSQQRRDGKQVVAGSPPSDHRYLSSGGTTSWTKGTGAPADGFVVVELTTTVTWTTEGGTTVTASPPSGATIIGRMSSVSVSSGAVVVYLP